VSVLHAKGVLLTSHDPAEPWDTLELYQLGQYCHK